MANEPERAEDVDDVTTEPIHKIPSQAMPSPAVGIQTGHSELTIKAKDAAANIELQGSTMAKIKSSVLTNWTQSGFIESIRGQIRCRLISEIKHPFKQQQPNLERRVLNSVVIDFLSKSRCSYALSVFQSEIGGALIGALSRGDTLGQLQLIDSESQAQSLLELLVNAYRHSKDETCQRKLMETERVLREERIAVEVLQKRMELQMQALEMDESSKCKALRFELLTANNTIAAMKKEIQGLTEKVAATEALQHAKVETERSLEKEWATKYWAVREELKNALEREKESQCLLDEERIKLNSAKREIAHLEQLIDEQSAPTSNSATLANLDTQYSHLESLLGDLGKTTHNTEFTETLQSLPTAEEPANPSAMFRPMRHEIETEKAIAAVPAVSAKIQELLELDIKRRLKRQAMLETDSRQLNRTTQQFFNQLNQQKSQQSEILQKLQREIHEFPRISATAPDLTQFMQQQPLSSEQDWQEKEYAAQRKKNKQALIQYTLDTLRNERSQAQREMRRQIKMEPTKARPIHTTQRVMETPTVADRHKHEKANVSRVQEIVEAEAESVRDAESVESEDQNMNAPNQAVDTRSFDITEPAAIDVRSEALSTAESSTASPSVASGVAADAFRAGTRKDDAHEKERAVDQTNQSTPRSARAATPTSEDESLRDRQSDTEDTVSAKDLVKEEAEVDEVAAAESPHETDRLEQNIEQTEAPPIETVPEDIGTEVTEDVEEPPMSEAERERLEREKLEQDLMDDITPSESFSGVDFLQDDFLEQYQRHIETIASR